MTNEASWLCKRIAVGTAVLLTGAALVAGEPVQNPTPALADDVAQVSVGSGSVTVTAGGTYDVDAATKLVDQINAVREAAGLQKLSWSSSLQVLAQTRAAEVAYMGSAAPAAPSQAAAENIVMSTSSADLTALVSDWLSDNGTSNYQNVVGSSTAVGISVFTADDGTLAVVAEFGADDAVQATPLNGHQTIVLNVAPSDLSAKLESDTPQLEVGGTASLSANLLLNGTAPVQPATPPVWSSSDPSVLEVAGNGLTATATALAAGNAQVNIALTDGTSLASVAIDVTAPDTEPAPEEVVEPDGNQGTVSEPGKDGEQGDAADPNATPNPETPGQAQPDETDTTDAATETPSDPDAATDSTVVPDAGNEDDSQSPEQGDDPDGSPDGASPDQVDGSQPDNPDDSATNGGTGQNPADNTQEPDTPVDDGQDVPPAPNGDDQTNTDPATDATDKPNDPGANGENPAAPDASGPDTNGEDAEKPATDEDSDQQTLPVVADFTDPEVYYIQAEFDSESLEKALEDIPGTVEVVKTDGTEGTIDVAWKFPEDLTPDSKGVLLGTAEVVVEKDRTSEYVDNSEADTKKVTQVVQFVTSYHVDQAEVDEGTGDPVITAEVHGSYAPAGSSAEPTEFKIPVTWDAIPAGATDEPGSFILKGTVNGNFSVETTVDVVEKAPTAVKAETPEPVTTQAGTAPILPASVMVVWSDGSQKSADVTWDNIPEEDYAQAGKTFQVDGTVEGTDLTVTIDVKVVQATPAVEAVEATTVETYVGTAPKLPESVKVTWSDDTTTEEKVSWVEVPASSYSKEGTVSVSGTLESYPNVTVSCTVKVLPLTIVSVEQPAAVNTEAGTAPVLPTTVNVTYSDGSVKAEPVSWAPVDASSYHNSGTFTVEGAVNGTDLTASITVNVAKPRVTGVQNNLTVETTAGTAPVLPKTASIRWSNGDTTDEAVTWDAVDAASYAQAGTFKARGTVAGQTVYCTVNVAARNAVVQTGDNSVPVAAIVAGAVAGVAIIAAAVALIVRARKNAK